VEEDKTQATVVLYTPDSTKVELSERILDGCHGTRVVDDDKRLLSVVGVRDPFHDCKEEKSGLGTTGLE
jgi:hypothetical protein